MIHLHRHSEFSPLDGTGTADQWAARAAEIGQGALALTDHATLGGTLHHVKACRENSITPIVGVEAYFRPDRSIRHDISENKPNHLTLFAANMKGWHSLLRITSEAYLTGFYGKPCVDWELLECHREGLMASTACLASPLSQAIIKDDEAGAIEFVQRMKMMFGDHFWLEVMPHDIEAQRTVNIELANLSQQYSVPLIATSDAHYPYADWAETQSIAFMISRRSSIEKEKKKAEAGEEVYGENLGTLYLMNDDEMRESFTKNHPSFPSELVDEAIKNTYDVVKATKLYVINRDQKLPKVSNSPDESWDIIQKWCEEGFIKIGKDADSEYRQRYEFEMDVLKQNGVLDYFVIVGDAVRWSKSKGIRVGLGRGSAAGSLVSYLIGITAIDPIAYGLLFERFLNPDRKGLPDIDLDFDSERRQEVKDYLASKYGQENVADIISYQTFGPRSAIEGVSKVFSVPYNVINEVKETFGPLDKNLDELVATNPILKKFSEDYPEPWKHALRLDNEVSAPSKHAAGVVISDKPIREYMPIQINKGKAKDGSEDSVVTAWADRAEFPIISDYGFLKIDLLGLEGLRKHEYACRMVEERTGEMPDLNGLPVLSDPYAVQGNVMDSFVKGITLGVFQFGGQGITQLLRHIKPESVIDIAVANALYRPGPIKIAFEYGDRKKNPNKVTYWHDSLEPILGETMGLIAFQEQVMEITKRIGNFTGGESDSMRKAISKLYRLPGNEARKFMEGFKQRWLQGCRDNGLKDREANEIWEKILEFAGYGFNKSHAASYALQAYQDMWLKVEHSLEFYAALLTYPKKVKGFVESVVREARMINVAVKPPDINYSDYKFTIDGNVLRYGLLAVKGIADATVNDIIDKRPFYSIEDFENRVEPKKTNVGRRKALVGAGALDEFGARDEWSGIQIKDAERELLGVPISIAQSVQIHENVIEKRIYSQEEFEALEDGDDVIVGGEILSNKVIVTKAKKEEMAFIEIAFKDNHWSCTLFPKPYRKLKHLLDADAVMVKGRKDNRGQIIVNMMMDLEELVADLEKE